MSVHLLKLINMRLHFALPRMTIGSYYTCMIHTFTRLTLISLILPNSQNAFYKVCTYTANSYKKRWPNHQYNIRPFKRVLKNKIYLHYNKQILLPSLITIFTKQSHLGSLTFKDRYLIKISTLKIRCEQGATASLKSHAYVPANNCNRIENNIDLCTPQRHTHSP